MARSKKDTERIKIAYEVGFRIVGGEVISPLGTKKRIQMVGRKRHFSMKVRGRSTLVDVNGLAAHQRKSGE